MRPRAPLISLSFVLSSWAGSACIAPAYPDDYLETGRGAQTSQNPSGPAFGSVDAALPPGNALPPPGGAMPTTPLGPPAFDAGSAIGGPGTIGGGTLGGGAVPGWPPARPEAGVDGGTGVAPDAGAWPDADVPQDSGGGATAASVSSCTITAKTDASSTSFFYYGKYGCAVWIGDSSKKVIKAFLVATRIASRSGLPGYRAASSGVRVDVTASATLSAPKQHQFTWALTDSSGAKVPPGQFTLNLETHSDNGVTLVTVPFDTSAPVSEMATPKAEVISASIVCD